MRVLLAAAGVLEAAAPASRAAAVPFWKINRDHQTPPVIPKRQNTGQMGSPGPSSDPKTFRKPSTGITRGGI